MSVLYQICTQWEEVYFYYIIVLYKYFCLHHCSQGRAVSESRWCKSREKQKNKMPST